jgi:hypothetical protein
MTCHLCNQPTYKHIRSGPLCVSHYLAALENYLGPWVELSTFYQQAKKDKLNLSRVTTNSTLPLFEMEMNP